MIGRTISHYKILEKLGEGGMGVVYKAEDTKLKRTVALKFLSPRAFSSSKDKIRFLHEAQAAAGLDHANICTVYEIDDARDNAFIAMAYVEGENLRSRLESGRLSVEEAVDFTIQAAEGLQVAHGKGVIHRDIKSANIMLADTGKIKIMDFGLAKLPGRARITKTGTTLGTVAYMSPEQVRGEAVDARSDVYSLGVVLYEMLTGRLPFQGDNEAAVIYKIINVEPEPLTVLRKDIPLRLQTIIEKALQKNPVERYQSALEMRRDLVLLARAEGFEHSGAFGAYSLRKERTLRLLHRSILPAALVWLILMLIPSDWYLVGNRVGKRGLPIEKHLLVLPLKNVGDDPMNRALCDGLAETLTSKLTQLEQYQGSLWVVPASEVRESKISSAGEAKRAFGANLVVTGSVQCINDRFIITLNLVDASSLRQLSSMIIDNRRENIAVLQDAALTNLAKLLNFEVTPQTRRALAAGGTTVLGAYEFYLQGRGYIQRYENLESLDAAIKLFERAITTDSLYALAYAGLGEAYWRKYELTSNSAFINPAQSYCERALHIDSLLAPVFITLGIINGGTGRYEQALEEFHKALKLDPRSYEGYLEMAIAYTNLDMRDEAESAYKKAMGLKPGYWSGYSHLGTFYWRCGDLEKAKQMFTKVTELTPDNIRGYNNLIGIYYLMNQPKMAEAMYKKSIAIKPNPVAYSNMGAVYIYEGNYADAVPVLEQAIKLGVTHYSMWGNLADSYRYTPGNEKKSLEAYGKAIELGKEILLVNPSNSLLRSNLAVFYAKSGDANLALEEVKRARAQAPEDPSVLYDCAIVYELSGQREEALAAIGKALDHGLSKEEVRKEPEFKKLYDEKRFKNLVKP